MTRMTKMTRMRISPTIKSDCCRCFHQDTLDTQRLSTCVCVRVCVMIENLAPERNPKIWTFEFVWISTVQYSVHDGIRRPSWRPRAAMKTNLTDSEKRANFENIFAINHRKELGKKMIRRALGKIRERPSKNNQGASFGRTRCWFSVQRSFLIVPRTRNLAQNVMSALFNRRLIMFWLVFIRSIQTDCQRPDLHE